ncbi:hypothetical protein DFH29DRAFT_871265 [Suillus ampliporus]|nr:hypothetical protein DFH29DRAFT_871265 [Suillus ampliporus]
MTAASGPSHTQAEQPVPAPAPVRHSNGLAASSQNTSSNSGSKPKTAKSLQSVGKRARVGDTNIRLDVTVQIGLYAAETNHILNLVVVGLFFIPPMVVLLPTLS